MDNIDFMIKIIRLRPCSAQYAAVISRKNVNSYPLVTTKPRLTMDSVSVFEKKIDMMLDETAAHPGSHKTNLCSIFHQSFEIIPQWLGLQCVVVCVSGSIV